MLSLSKRSWRRNAEGSFPWGCYTQRFSPPESEGHRGSSPHSLRHCAPFLSSMLFMSISPTRQSLLCTVAVQMFHIIFKQMTAERIWDTPTAACASPLTPSPAVQHLQDCAHGPASLAHRSLPCELVQQLGFGAGCIHVGSKI